jgi:septal ring factor EnvC (AmiA/AmiB activator)
MLARFTKAALVALMILALPVAAMAAAAPDKAEKVAAKMLDLDKAITTISTQLDVTLNSMNALAEPNGDLTAKYKAFTDNTAKLDKMAAKAKSTSQTAASQREEYLKQMQAAAAEIQNPDLKANLEKRKAELSPKIEQIKTSLGSARDIYGPFMQDLKDLSLFLGNQLNANGVASASTLMAKCTTDGGKMKAELASASEGVKSLAAAIQPGAPAK